MSDYQLFHGDCLDILPTLSGVDAVITDPPYGIGIAENPFRQKHDVKDWDNLPATDEMISEILKIGKVQIIWGGNYFNLPPARCFLIWDKVQPENFSSAMCEFAWTNIDAPAKIFKRHVVTYEKFHPTTKPLELMTWQILKYTNPGDTILDPFMGSGTTGVACIQTGRKFIGIEKEREYFEIAERRIQNAQPPLFV
jgi:site-specific DNA-methyltransferase (adenine-specific)